MKKNKAFGILSLLTAVIMFISQTAVYAAVADNIPFDINAESAVLIEAETGTVLFAKTPIWLFHRHRLPKS